MTETRISQEDIDIFKQKHGLCPESLEELYKQNRIIDLFCNYRVLRGIRDKFHTGEFVSAIDGVTNRI